MIFNRIVFILIALVSFSLSAYSQQPVKASVDTNRVKKSYSKEDIDKLIKDNKILILDFSASWCQPCKEMAPVMDEIEKENAGKVKLVRVDYDINRQLSNSMQVYEIPYLMIYVDGKISQNVVGMMEKKVILEMLPLK